MHRSNPGTMPAQDGGDGFDPRTGPYRTSRATEAGSCKAARDGVTRGLRSLYSDIVSEPLPDDMRALIDRLGAPSR